MMAQWPFPTSAPPAMSDGAIPAEWLKANEALQAVKQPSKIAAAAESPIKVKQQPLQHSNVTTPVNEYPTNPFPWQQQPQPPMFPAFTGFPQYSPNYNFYNYNFSYMNHPYYMSPMPPATPIPPPSPSAPLPDAVKPESEGAGSGESENPSPNGEAGGYLTEIANPPPPLGAIRFNLPKKRNPGATFQTTREVLQKRMNNFRPPEKSSPPVTQDGTMRKSVTGMAHDSWSPSLRNFVNRCFEKCKTDLDKDQVELILKGKLMKASNDGTIQTKNWDKEPLPSIHSDRLEEEEQTRKLAAAIRYHKFKEEGRERNSNVEQSSSKSGFHPKNRSSYRSRSRSRSYSRSRSRSPLRRVYRRRRNSSSSSSDSSSNDSKSSSTKKALNSSVISPAELRSMARYTSPLNNKNKKKKRKPKATPFIVDSEMGSDERLMKRAARFETKGSSKTISKSNNLTFTITNQPLFFIDNTGEGIEWNSDAVIGTSQDLEKPYLRLTGVADPSSVRPEEILVKSLLMVKEHWVKNQDYHFVCEQLKSIRQDLMVQCITNNFTVQVYETHARIALEKGDHTEFNQCQSQLKVLYLKNELNKDHRLEFVGYHILYTLFTESADELKNILADLKPDEKKDEVVSNALKLANAYSSNNYYRFFKLYLAAPKMSSFIIDWFIERIRKSSLKAIVKSFRPNIPISYIQSALAFPTVDECLAFLAKANLILVDATTLNCKDSVGALVNL